MTSPIILFLGAGKNTGLSVANLFAKNGYKVALASRSGTPLSDSKEYLNIKADFSNPDSIQNVFEEVQTKFGIPNVVVYNAAQATFNPSLFKLPISTIASSATIAITSGFAAIKSAVEGFEKLPGDVNKTFIYTGNKLNVVPMPQLLDLGIGKAGAAHLIHAATLGYNKDGFNFYYADERKADGGSAGGDINGDNHAEFFWKLVGKKDQGPWDATFVRGEYVDFGGN